MADEDWAPKARSEAPSAPLPDVPATAPIEVPGFADFVEVARGGDSIVYRTRQLSLDREVAMKVVQLKDASAEERFRREVAITVRLGRQHPHIVTVLDTTTATTGELCLIMDFHDLGSLHDRVLGQGPLSASEVVEAGTAVADALAFAHRAGVLHRDVKPQNILVLPTSFVLSDFGIARQIDADRTASLELFSYRHASPQVLDGLTPTEADDVWSLGSTLFTLLDGRAPFAGNDPDDDTALAYLRRVRLNQRRPLRRTDLPAGLRELIDGCLEPDREKRIATAEQALAMLRGIRTEGRSWEPGVAASASSAASASPTADHAATAAPVAQFAAPASAPADSIPPGAAPADSIPAAPAPEPAGAPASEPRVESAPPVTSSPVSRSALADLDDRALQPPPGADDDATGTLTAAEKSEPARPSPPRTTMRRIIWFIAGMLLAGAAIGAISALIPRGTPDAPITAPPTDGAVVPTTTTPPEDDGTQPTVSDPDFAPRGLVVTDQGTSALLTWAPPTQEVTSLAIVQLIEGEAPVVLANLPGTATEFTVEGLDPDATACFAVAGYGTKDGEVIAGSTPETCTP